MPCKSLSRAVELVNRNGKIVLTGEQKLNETISISKNITIEGLAREHMSVITGKRNVTVAFKSENMSTIIITGIHFKNIAVLSMNEQSSVRIVNCSVNGSKEPVFQLNVGIALYISNSRFIDMAGYLINHDDSKSSSFKTNARIKIYLHNCSLINTKGVRLMYVTGVDLVVRRSSFNKVHCPAVYMQHTGWRMTGRRTGTVNISGSTLNNSAWMCKNGGFISLNNVNSAIIEYSIFSNGKVVGFLASGGALYVFDTNTLK